MEPSIYNVLSKSKKASLASFNKLRDLKGLICLVKRPVHEGSIFGLEDIVEYDEMVVTKEKLLLFGIFQEGEQGIEEFDTFVESYALTTWDEKLPLQTEIEVQFCGRTMTFKVDTHRNVTPSVCGHLFIKNMLVPAT